MTEGTKPRRASTVETPAPSAFAPLRPFLRAGNADVSKSFEELSAELVNFDSRVCLDVKVLEGSSTHTCEVACGQDRSAKRRSERRKKPDVRVVVRHDAWLQIARGQLHPFDAFISGRLMVGGDIALAKRLVEHLTDPSVPYVSPC